MTKKEFIKCLAYRRGITQTEAASILEEFTSILRTELTSGNSVNLGTNFGTFKPTSRSGVIPGTDKPYDSKSVKFKIAAPFKREL